MTTQTRPITADDLLRMPDDGFRYELIEGTLSQTTLAGHQHGRIAINVSTPLAQHVKANNLGVVYAAETGFKLASDPDTVRAPDVAFVRRERVEAVGDSEGFWPGTPDLAVEVISPGDSYTDVEENLFDWLDAGTRLVIVANPRKRLVTVYRSLTDVVVLTEADVLDGGDVVPGFAIPVKDIFAL